MSENEAQTPNEEAQSPNEEAQAPKVPETPEQVVARETAKSPTRGMCAAILGLETVALGLTSPVLITIAEVPVALGLTIGLGLAVLCVVAAGMLRRPVGYWLGGAIQVAAIALGFVIPMMFVLGGIFALLWFGAIGLGRKIEREKKAAWYAWLEEQRAQEA